MSRTVPEWIGKTDDSRPPQRVRARVFEAYGGKCHISGVKITASDKWELDHVIALINGGENRESNLAPALPEPHKKKTADDVAIKKKVARRKARFTGAKRPEGKIKSRGFGAWESNTKQLDEEFSE